MSTSNSASSKYASPNANMEVCGACQGENEDDTDVLNWVQCDKCGRWFHFHCAGVDSNVAEKSWICEKCMQAAVNAMESTVAQPVIQTAYKNTSPQRPQSSRRNETEINTINMEALKVSEMQATMRSLDQHHTISNKKNVTTRAKINQATLMLAMLDEERKAQQEYFEKKYALLSQMSESDQTLLFSPQNAEIPTSSQIAARQAIPRELPNFSGDPEEWPLFISTFESSTKVAGFNETENMLRLQKALKGKARELVKDKLLLPSHVHDVIKILRTFFGRPEHILERLIEKVRKLPPPKDKLELLIDFALSVRNICSTMESCNMKEHLSNPLLVKELVDKLPNQQKLNWAMQKRDGSIPAIKAFSDWLYQMAEAASTVVQPISIKSNAVNTHSESTDKVGDKFACKICKNKDHRVHQCEKFKKLNAQERWKAVKEHSLCRTCLKAHKGRCYSNKECGVNGCKYRHHPLLHQQEKEGDEKTEAATHAHHNSTDKSFNFFRIVPVKVYNKGRSTEVYAFLDEGSSVTLLDQKIFDELKLQGTSDPLCLRWTNDATRSETESIRTSIQISSVNNDRKYWLNNARTVTHLSLPTQTVDAALLQKKFKHFSGVPLPSYTNATPLILIGADNWKLAVPRRIHEGGWCDPIASKCLLGWAVQGGHESKLSNCLNVHSCPCNYEELHEIVKTSFNLEPVAPRNITAEDDARAMRILDESCVKRDGRYEVGLLWKDDDVRLPDSHENALKRLKCLKQRMEKDAVLKTTVQERIENLLEKGYAREVTRDEASDGCVWYLPIFIATNPNKNKVRLVWDGAAKCKGQALNDFLMTGPDLLNPLNTILMSFRVGAVALCGDIAEMYHRINIKEPDLHAQRFLWWTDDNEPQPRTFVMRAMTFGIRCAPCIAHYVRNKNAAKFAEIHPEAVEAIEHAHYVDDYIDSCSSVEQAIKLASEVREIHATGGFNIRNWASNSTEVMRFLQEYNQTSQAPVDLCDTEKVLGMCWDPNRDVFKFNFRFVRLRRDVLCDSVIPTKREALQMLMSVFDPLGFLAPFTINLKILLQQIWQSGCGWDDDIPKILHQKWAHWKSSLKEVAGIEVPRLYSEIWSETASVELHTFVDASEDAYAACCYLRVQSNNRVTVSLVASKSKVAPLKPLSIPRLELQAAVIGVRLAETVAKARKISIGEFIYWSDSKTVLRWLRMNTRSFQQFVMHRVGEILETSDVRQWRWVDTKSNSADLATKMHTNVDKKTWFGGPKFLEKEKKDWPSCLDLGPIDQSEIRRHAVNMHQRYANNVNAEYFSDWKRLYRAVANFLLYLERLKSVCRRLQKPPALTHEMIDEAKKFLFREAQKSVFTAEINSLEHHRYVNKQSAIRGLNVYLDEDHIVRVQGRNYERNVSKDPIVLPKNHHTTYLIVKRQHEDLHHGSHETAVNLIKAKYYVPRLRVLYKKIRNSCQRCKIDLARPDCPQMAPIPRARLASFERPFTYVGVDYFGPINVILGRRREKRWGVLYTCLTLRAVHIEVAHSLDTSSCIFCLRNFIARRGTPREIFSDNGTNFKATAKIITDELRNVDFATLEAKFDSIKWRFNPPSAPHMGGAWERLVRSIKEVLGKMYPNERFHDESLRNALCEVEFIINTRPLTFVSMDSADEEALTPNHLLLGSADGCKTLSTGQSDLRLRWRQTQIFADNFWRRWVREYGPTLLKREKWHEKRPPIRVGDVVIVVDESLPRNCWPKGLITEVTTAADGQVRQAIVRTKSGTLRRPTAKLAVLDVSTRGGRLTESGFICGAEDVAAKK